MQTIHFSDEYEQSVQGSPWALMLYQREFKDEEGKNADFYADWVDYLIAIDDAQNGKSATIDVMFLIKTAWAMAKNADDSVPNFETWARESAISMEPGAPWMTEVQTAIFAEIFRRKPITQKAEKTTRKGSAGRRTDRRKTDSGS